MEEEVKSEAGKEKEKVEEKSLDKMTTTELKEIAMEIPGVVGATAMKKEELLSIIKEYRGIEDEAPKKTEKNSKHKADKSIKDIKIKIAHLREEKEKKQGEKDRKQVDILRRRINRLKRQTRKAAQG
ncbi:MAG: transcription termination factor Rho [Thermodesulfobacteriota bacterium]|nr:transcription termination factor Rho [Thermodesulfobacteriota bacterium]